MTEFGLINRAFLKEFSDHNLPNVFSGLVWKTCLREVYFFDSSQVDDSEKLKLSLENSDQIYLGLSAEVFLAEILCGLKSQLIGETEVFGQFKSWWKAIPVEHEFKRKFNSRIETLFALVKTVREKSLCGHGSQSYGSLLRRNIQIGEAVDIIGAGHLTEEILPWVKDKTSCRLWVRNTEKAARVAKTTSFDGAIIQLDQPVEGVEKLARTVICAAPMSHSELNQFMKNHGVSCEHQLFDFRQDSATFDPFTRLSLHKKLSDFSTAFESNRCEIEKKALEAKSQIQSWMMAQKNKSVLRPFGWDDL